LLPEAGSPGALALPLYWRKEDLAVLEGCSTRPIAELNLEVGVRKGKDLFLVERKEIRMRFPH
jgi:hypothetical protein